MLLYYYYLDDSELALALPSGVLEALQLETCDANDVVARLQGGLSLEQTSLEQPDPETKRKIRCLCMRAKDGNRLDFVKQLREIVPAGTTGEVFFHIHVTDVEPSQCYHFAMFVMICVSHCVFLQKWVAAESWQKLCILSILSDLPV